MEPSHRLLGAWRLTAYDDRESVDDEWGKTYGADPVGLAIYDKTGCLSMQICEANGSRFDAYFGRFAISGVSEENGGDLVGVVHHEVVASSMPEMLTADPTRPFRISGATLVLGDGLTWRRIFERVG
jgi:lipocalin-like protein